jgi:hypothetical protein
LPTTGGERRSRATRMVAFLGDRSVCASAFGAATRRFEQAEKQMPPRRSFYTDANDPGTDGHPVDDEVERRTEDADLKQRIITAQGHLLARLDDKRLYLALEELFGERTEAREEAMFNVGFEHGYMQGRRDTLAALWRRTPRGRTLAKKITQLTMDAHLTPPHAIAALLEVAWSFLTRPESASGPRPPRAGESKK